MRIFTEAHSAATAETQPTVKALRTFVWLLLVLCLIGWTYELLGRTTHLPLSGDYSALFHPTSNFGDHGDFTDLTGFERQLDLPCGSGLIAALHHVNYPPFAALLVRLFLCGFRNPVLGFAGCLLAASAACAAVLWLRIRRIPAPQQLRHWLTAAMVSCALCSSPLWFCLDRGNLEWVGALAVAGAVVLWLRNAPWLASVLLALAISCKPYPVLFLLLFLWRRQWLPACNTLVTAFAVNALALRALTPQATQALHSMGGGWQAYALKFVLTIRNEQEFRFNHSLLDMVKVPIWFVLFHQRTHFVPLTAGAGVPLWARLDLWSAFFAVVALAAVAYVALRFRARSSYDQVFALTLLTTLLPSVSAEYTLVLLYLPLALLAVTLARTHHAPRAAATLLPFALLLSPLNFMGPFTGVTKTLCLIVLCVGLAQARYSLAEPAHAAPRRRRLSRPTPEPLVYA